MALIEIKIPDIGGATDVEVIELMVVVGDTVEKDQSLVTLESDKATMEVPSTEDGVIKALKIKVGDKLSEGSVIAMLETSAGAAEAKPESKTEAPASKPESESKPAPATKSAEPVATQSNEDLYAGPAVRRIARELDLDLTKIKGTGDKGRITKDDVKKHVKTAMQGGGNSGGFALPAMPAIDFSQFGEIEEKPLTKINKLTGQFLSRNWISIPHVTQFESADITELEAFRKSQKPVAEKQGIKLTPIVFIMKAVVEALKTFPNFNASLDPSGEKLILKKYINIGVAVDTPNGLVVAVIRDVAKKSLFELAKELGEMSKKAREKGLSMAEMQGGCFTISSLGGIGGTAFTPIVNAPEVAILGVSKASMQPVYDEGVFVPRLMLPLSLSYDHRVIDGAAGARFAIYLKSRLEDIRTLLL